VPGQARWLNTLIYKEIKYFIEVFLVKGNPVNRIDRPVAFGKPNAKRSQPAATRSVGAAAGCDL
jgi:hypothetical protein